MPVTSPNARIVCSTTEWAPEYDEQIIDGLRAFNRVHLGPHERVFIKAVLLDSEGKVVGGALGSVVIGWLHVDALWVADSHRGNGYGSRILRTLEQESIPLGAKSVYLETLGFQAEGFYLKQGYAECGRIQNFAQDWDHIFLHKELT